MAYRPILFGMSDKKLKERLAALSQEGRIRVLLHVALNWKELKSKKSRRGV